MTRTSKFIHLLETGDLLFIAESSKNSVEWVDLALFIDGEIIHTIHLGDGSTKSIKQFSVEYLNTEHRPIGIFRLNSSSKEIRHNLATSTITQLLIELSWYLKLKNLFTQVPRNFNWNNQLSIKDLLLNSFNFKDIKSLESQANLLRLL